MGGPQSRVPSPASPRPAPRPPHPPIPGRCRGPLGSSPFSSAQSPAPSAEREPGGRVTGRGAPGPGSRRCGRSRRRRRRRRRGGRRREGGRRGPASPRRLPRSLRRSPRDGGAVAGGSERASGLGGGPAAPAPREGAEPRRALERRPRVPGSPRPGRSWAPPRASIHPTPEGPPATHGVRPGDTPGGPTAKLGSPWRVPGESPRGTLQEDSNQDPSLGSTWRTACAGDSSRRSPRRRRHQDPSGPLDVRPAEPRRVHLGRTARAPEKPHESPYGEDGNQDPSGLLDTRRLTSEDPQDEDGTQNPSLGSPWRTACLTPGSSQDARRLIPSLGVPKAKTAPRTSPAGSQRVLPGRTARAPDTHPWGWSPTR